MPLEKIYLSRTPVSDLSALEGAPLVEVNIVDTRVSDIAPLAKSPIQMLWLTGTPVTSIAALKGMPLVSLTLHKTKVTDLSPLSGSALQRLHIGETPVTDLTPLKGLSLTRLVFTPAGIKAGLDVARSLPLQEIGTKFDEEGRDLMPPEAFWAQQGK
jgi:internalin A